MSQQEHTVNPLPLLTVFPELKVRVQSDRVADLLSHRLYHFVSTNLHRNELTHFESLLEEGSSEQLEEFLDKHIPNRNELARIESKKVLAY